MRRYHLLLLLLPWTDDGCMTGASLWLQKGCWGPPPSCPECKDGCYQCKAGFGGSDCRIPVHTDIYEPDGLNTLIRLTFLRNLVDYNHTIVPGRMRSSGL